MDVLTASPTEPLPEKKRNWQMMFVWQALRSLEVEEKPTADDLRVVSDVLNMMDTLIKQGILSDESKLIEDAMRAVIEAHRRAVSTGVLRFDGSGMTAIRGVVSDYSDALDVLPARVMIDCHRRTEMRVNSVLAGKRGEFDIVI